MSEPITNEESVVDARGLRCPLPVIRIAALARDAPAGALVTVLWTDPAAAHDLPAWARMRGHQLVATVALPDAATDGDEGVPRDDPVEAEGPLPGDGTGAPADRRAATSYQQAFATTVRIVQRG